MIGRGRWLACALAVGLAQCAPVDVAGLAPAADEAWAFRTLARSRAVVSAAVGEGGEATAEGCAMRVLLDSGHARERFAALYAHPAAEARTYAAMGLCLSGSPRCGEAREALRGDTTRMETVSGCFVSTMLPSMLLSTDERSYGSYVGARGCQARHLRGRR